MSNNNIDWDVIDEDNPDRIPLIDEVRKNLNHKLYWYEYYSRDQVWYKCKNCSIVIKGSDIFPILYRISNYINHIKIVDEIANCKASRMNDALE